MKYIQRTFQSVFFILFLLVSFICFSATSKKMMPNIIGTWEAVNTKCLVIYEIKSDHTYKYSNHCNKNISQPGKWSYRQKSAKGHVYEFKNLRTGKKTKLTFKENEMTDNEFEFVNEHSIP